MKDKMNYRTHASPVWREKANALVQAKLEDDSSSEQLWCRKLGDDKFEVCCIPFFLYDVALGDIVLAPEFHLHKVVRPSGRFVFRAYLAEDQREWRDSLQAQLEDIEAQAEWYSTGLVSIDAPNLEKAETISTWLSECEQHGFLTYETGKL